MTRQQLYQLIVPTPAQLLVYPLLSLMLFILVFSHSLIHKLTGSDVALSSLSTMNYQAQVAKYLDNNFVHTLVIILFWSLIGLVSYTAVWLVTNAIINARNEVVVETAYTNKGAASGRVRSQAERVAFACLFLTFVALSAVLLIPVWLHAFTNFLVAPLGLISLAWALFGVLGLALNTYLAVTLGQAVFNLS